MAAEISSVRSKHHGFMTLLSSAICEWFLIFLLFVDVVFSYLLTKFAHYSELQAPCPLCSRIDHVFAKRKPGCYWNLACNNHKDEISSLVSCSIHNKLADVHGMCEECLMPTVIRNRSNSESYRMLVGKLWVNVERSVVQSLMLNKRIQLGSLGRGICSCCNKSWRAKSNAERLLAIDPVGLGASKANVKLPLPRVPGRSRFRHRDSFKRLRDKSTEPMGCDSADTLSYVGYTKLKISSDSEMEVPFSEDDDVGFGRRDIIKAPHQGSEMKDQPDLLDLDEPKNVNSLPSDVLIEHGLGELNWEEVHHKPSHHLTTELISLDDVNQQPDLGALCSSVLSELLSLHTNPLSSDNVTIANKSINISGNCENVNTSVTIHIEAATGTSSDNTHLTQSDGKNVTDSLSQNAENSKLSCPNSVEQINASDPAKTERDTKPPSEVSTAEVGLLSRKDEDSSSMKRNDSSYESLDRISVHDIEGENIVDRLRRQVEHDRSCINSLYKELEEERNAAAVAANEAMAMITRLQEEKAALCMEALQYLRMMEEQAEYDMEELERANNLLAKKEKDLQDLERELEFFRSNLVGIEDIRKETSENCVRRLRTPKANGKCSLLSNFEDEKLYISRCLRKLEKMIHQDIPNGATFEKIEELCPNMERLLNFEIEENTNDVGDDGCYEKSDKLSEDRGDTNMAFFKKEIAALKNRLEALEMDQDELKNASQELGKMEMERR